jgi:hypothetical protein
MRFLLGMVFGASLLVLAAHVADDHTGNAARRQQNLVNWELVGQKFANVKSQVQREWANISSNLSSMRL